MQWKASLLTFEMEILKAGRRVVKVSHGTNLCAFSKVSVAGEERKAMAIFFAWCQENGSFYFFAVFPLATGIFWQIVC